VTIDRSAKLRTTPPTTAMSRCASGLDATWKTSTAALPGAAIIIPETPSCMSALSPSSATITRARTVAARSALAASPSIAAGVLIARLRS
jgi:hypothetical protein